MAGYIDRLLTDNEKGRILAPEHVKVEGSAAHAASGVTVDWSWYNESSGTVLWTFRNGDSKQHSMLLLRNGYYFAGAFWPVYYANSGGRGASAGNPGENFGTNFLPPGSRVAPLPDRGVKKNNPPIGLVTFSNSDPKKVNASNSQVLFIFTLSPGEKWAMVEGGFSAQMTPANISLHEVAPEMEGDFCIGYDQKRVTDWDKQTGTSLGGYSPDPSTIKTWLLSAEAGTPFLELHFKDRYAYGSCP